MYASALYASYHLGVRRHGNSDRGTLCRRKGILHERAPATFAKFGFGVAPLHLEFVRVPAAEPRSTSFERRLSARSLDQHTHICTDTFCSFRFSFHPDLFLFRFLPRPFCPWLPRSAEQYHRFPSPRHRNFRPKPVSQRPLNRQSRRNLSPTRRVTWRIIRGVGRKISRDRTANRRICEDSRVSARSPRNGSGDELVCRTRCTGDENYSPRITVVGESGASKIIGRYKYLDKTQKASFLSRVCTQMHNHRIVLESKCPHSTEFCIALTLSLTHSLSVCLSLSHCGS